MIYLYSGTPGSGKSLHVARDIMNKLRRKENVIANFPINLELVEKGLFKKRKIGDFIYKNDKHLTVDFLVNYAKKNHVVGLEGQTLLVVDECQRIWASRGDRLTRKEIAKWEDFFSLHRHLGYNIILVSQKDRMIARYLRDLLEYDVIHRKVNNFGIGMLFPLKTFVAVSYWYGVKTKLDVEFFTFKKRFQKLYNSYGKFDEEGSGSSYDDNGIEVAL